MCQYIFSQRRSLIQTLAIEFPIKGYTGSRCLALRAKLRMIKAQFTCWQSRHIVGAPPDESHDTLRQNSKRCSQIKKKCQQYRSVILTLYALDLVNVWWYPHVKIRHSNTKNKKKHNFWAKKGANSQSEVVSQHHHDNCGYHRTGSTHGKDAPYFNRLF